MRKGLVAAIVAGCLLVVEAVVSLVMDSHVGYHALNSPLNAMLAWGVWTMVRTLAVGRLGQVGAWIAIVPASIAALGGLVPVVLEGGGLGTSPGWLEGITHTMVLVVFLGLVLLAVDLVRRRLVPRPAALTLLVGSALPIALVVAGLDDPRVFLAPEAIAGIGLAWAAWAVRGRSS